MNRPTRFPVVVMAWHADSTRRALPPPRPWTAQRRQRFRPLPAPRRSPSSASAPRREGSRRWRRSSEGSSRPGWPSSSSSTWRGQAEPSPGDPLPVTRLPVMQATDGVEVSSPTTSTSSRPGANLALFEGQAPPHRAARRARMAAAAGGLLLPLPGQRVWRAVHGGRPLRDRRGRDARAPGHPRGRRTHLRPGPATARFPGCLSAAAAGADSVLSPEAIAEELERISRHPYLRGSIAPAERRGPEEALHPRPLGVRDRPLVLQVRHRPASHRATDGAEQDRAPRRVRSLRPGAARPS